MRLFVLGDSFAQNGFDRQYHTPEMLNYADTLTKNNIEKPLWWTDWLEKWGYEIHNFGLGGCTIDEILYQFGKIDTEYKEGDRLIIWLTDFTRFYFVGPTGDVDRIMVNKPYEEHASDCVADFLQWICVNRDLSVNDENGFLRKNILPFIDYLITKHKNYKPLVFNRSETDFRTSKYFVHLDYKSPLYQIRDKLIQTIHDETNKINIDHHYGRYGNYFIAKLIDYLIKSEVDGDYITNKPLIDEFINLVNTDDITFEMPNEWKK